MPARRHTGAIQSADATLRRALRSIGARCATFYVRDPWYTNELRLVSMPGVRVKEPMHGFASFPGGDDRGDSGTIDVHFYDDVRNDPTLTPAPLPVSLLHKK